LLINHALNDTLSFTGVWAAELGTLKTGLSMTLILGLIADN